MKLVVSAYACIPNRGSEPSNGWNWALELARLGHQVWCVTTPIGRDVIATEMVKYPDLQLTFIYVDVPNWLNYMYRFQPFIYLHYLWWQTKASKVARRLDRELNFDIVLHASMSSFQLGTGMWRLKKPLVFGPVGGGSFPPKAFKEYFVDAWRTEVVRGIASKLLLLFNRDIRRVCKEASIIIVANEDTLAMAKRAGAKRLKMYLDVGLPNGYFPDQMPVRKPSEVIKLLWVGRLLPRKGITLVLEALSHLPKDLGYHLTILGDGQHGYLVPQLIGKYELEEKVTWCGQVPWQEVVKAYLQHQVFIFCSLRDSFGGQYLEAMANALPLIYLDHMGAGDHIPDDAGIGIEVSNPHATKEAIARAITYFCEHPDECQRRGAVGFNFARMQTWDARARWMSSIFDEMLLK
jgi:glycosyltransferase involved in cell wall biosynthesis